jgi:ABC-type uncharacterized transport system involved in gliding motility auxiliary subunit
MTAASQRLRVLAVVPAMLAVFLFGQGVLDALGWRLDLTPERRYTLSAQAERVLATLPVDVRLLGFLRSQDPRNVVIRDLLRQIEQRSPRVRVEIVDVNRSPSLAREYDVESSGAVVVEAGGRRRVVTNAREDVLLGAIVRVTRQERRRVVWVVGHGEGDVTSTDRRTGFSTARRTLEREYFEVIPQSLVGADVPDGTAAVIVAGPVRDFLPEELAALDRYLQHPGQALVLVDPERAPALTAWLAGYGIRVGDDVVVDPSGRLYGGEHLTMQLAFERGDHAILAPLTAPPLFSRSRSVAVGEAEGRRRAGQVLLHTSAESWSTSPRAAIEATGLRFVAGRDRRGPIGVGVDVAFSVPARDAEAAQGRLVVFGNAQFANNFFIELLGNKDLFVNTVAWVAREREGIAHRPPQQVPGVNQFFVSEADGAALFWASAVYLPGVFALLGLGQVLRRRWS